jgi:hypothetical protein
MTDVEEGISALLVVEIARDRHAHVRLILVVGALQDDRLVAHLAAGIVDGELGGDDAADPARIGKYGSLVVQNGDWRCRPAPAKSRCRTQWKPRPQQ